MSARTTYQLLGPVQAHRDGGQIDLGGPKHRAVLAALLLDAGRVVSTDRLVLTVWGEHPPPSTTTSLQALISNLRRALRDENLTTSPITRRSPGYVIEVETDALDLDRFVAASDTAHALSRDQRWPEAVDEAERALGFWRGPVLQDFADEEWVAVISPPYDERRLVCQQDLVTALLGTGRTADALSLSGRLLGEHPLDERVCWLHVLSLHRAGRTADALAVWRTFAQTLDEELGLEVGPALRDLQGAILRQDADLEHWPGTHTPSLLTAVASDTGTPGSASAAGKHGLAPGRLIGRKRQLDAIALEWEEATRGASPWVLLTGPAGIGKTRLAEEAARLWRDAGRRVVRVSCPDDPALPAWWPVRQLFKELGAEADGILVADEGEAELTRFAIYERVQALLATLVAREPLMLQLDDVHWADSATLDLLTYLAETVRVPGLAVLLTARNEIETGDGARLVSALARRPASRLGLPPLDDDEIAALVEQVSGEGTTATEVAALAERTGGNPFFVTEYARLPPRERTSGEVPLAVRAVMERRLSSVGPHTLAVLRTAAVIGEPLDLTLLRSTVQLEPEELADLLDSAADAHILLPDMTTGGYAFAHALIREALAAGLSPVRREALHQRVAAALAGRGDTDAMSRRAQHLLAAGPAAQPSEVVEACRAIALDADRRWAAQEAAQWWHHALRASEQDPGSTREQRDELVVALLDAHVRAGQGQRMLDLVDESLSEAWRDGRTSSVGVVASMLLRLTGAWPWPAYGSDPGALTSRLAGLESRLRAHPAAHARVLASLAVGSCYDPDPLVPDTLSQRAIDIAETTGDREVLADAILGRAMTYAGVAERAEETIGLVERLARLGHRRERFDEVIGHGIASMATIALGDLPASLVHVRVGAERSEALRLPVSRAQFRWAENLLARWQTGDVETGEELISAAYRQHQQTELMQSVTVVLARLCLRWDEGRLAEGVGVEMDNPFLAPWIGAAVSAARGEPHAADLLRREVARPEPTTWTSHGRLTLLAHAVADLGLVDLAPRLLPRLEGLTGLLGSFGHCGVLGPVDLARARLLLLSGDLEAAQGALTRAFDLAVVAGGPSWTLRCRVLDLQLEALQGRPLDAGQLADVREDALARGLLGVVREVDRLRA